MKLYNVVRATTQRFSTSREKYRIRQRAPWKRYLNSNGKHTVARCVVTSARNRSRRTRVRDHCHLTVDTAVQRIQIVTYKNSFDIPIVFHNLSGYDAHFIIKETATAYEGHVDVLPITKENIFHSLNMSIAPKIKMKRIFRKKMV